MVEMKNMYNSELETLKQKIVSELTTRKESNEVVVNLRDEMNKVLVEHKITHHNGGWCKLVTALDYRKANGYSIVGEFVSDSQATKRDYWKVNTIFMDCDNVKNYHLFILHPNGMELLGYTSDSDYNGTGYISDGSLIFRLKKTK